MIETSPSQERVSVSEPPQQLGRVLRLVPSLYRVGELAVFGAILIIGLMPNIDTDIWWHMEVGRYIVGHHAVPTRDYLSYTFQGRVWTDHEWLSEVIMYVVYRMAGLYAVIGLFAAIIGATYAFVYRTLRRWHVHPLLALSLLFLACFPATASWGARAQMFTLFFLAIFGYLLQRFRSTGDRRLLLPLPLLMIVWTNLHGGFVLGLVLVGAVLAGESLNVATGRNHRLGKQECVVLGWTLLLCAGATVINPNGIREVLYPLMWVVPSAYANILVEWLSPDFHRPAMMAFEALILLLITSLLIARPRLDWTELILILVFTHLALQEGRNVAVWSVVLTPLLGSYVQAAFIALRSGHVSRVRRRASPRVAPVMNVTLLFLAFLLYGVEVAQYINPVALQRNEVASYPVGAVNYLARHRGPSRVFASYGWAGYLLWQRYPFSQDFMDGRANTLFDDHILHAYQDIYGGGANWQANLDMYQTKGVLVETQSVLAGLLLRSPRWRLLYRDAQAVLFVRQSVPS